MDTTSLHGIDLSLGRAAAAADDGAGVTHAAPRRGGEPGDKAHHRFGDLLLDKSGRLLLGVPTDLAHHDDAGGGVVGLEGLQAVDEVGAVDRVAADADAGGLADPLLGELVTTS